MDIKHFRKRGRDEDSEDEIQDNESDDMVTDKRHKHEEDNTLVGNSVFSSRVDSVWMPWMDHFTAEHEMEMYNCWLHAAKAAAIAIINPTEEVSRRAGRRYTGD